MMVQKIVTICGSERQNSYNQYLINFIKQETISCFQLHSLPIDQLPFLTEAPTTNQLIEINYVKQNIADAAGIIIATPEINGSAPANIKNLIDWCSLEAGLLTDKPVMLLGASLGLTGTILAQQSLRHVLTYHSINAKLTHQTECFVANAQDKFSPTGELIDKPTQQAVGALIAEFKTLLKS